MTQRTRTFLIILILFAVSVTYAKSFSDDVKYLDSASICGFDTAKYNGVQFVFHSFIKYDGKIFSPPFPYKDGRARDGRFKASETAMNNYIEHLSDYNGKSFTLAKIVFTTEKVNGIVMVCENGDSLYFNMNIIRLFINKDFYKQMQQYKGMELIYNVPMSNLYAVEQRPVLRYFTGFTDSKTNKTIFYLPYLSKWKITDVVFDTMFVDAPGSIVNDNLSFCRIRFTIENKKYGTYYYFADNLYDITKHNAFVEREYDCKDSIYNGKLHKECFEYNGYWIGSDIFSNELNAPVQDGFWKSINIEYAFAVNNKDYSDEERKLIDNWASKGYVEAVFAKASIEGSLGAGYSQPSNILMQCIRDGYPPAIAYVVKNSSFISGSESTPWKDVFKGMKQAYNIYGKHVELDKLFDASTILAFPEIKKADDIELEKVKIYEKAAQFGYAPSLAKEKRAAYEKQKRAMMAEEEENAFVASFTEEYILSNSFESILKKIQQFKSKRKCGSGFWGTGCSNFLDVVRKIIQVRVQALWEIHKKNREKMAAVTVYETQLKLCNLAASYGYKFESEIRDAERNIGFIKEGEIKGELREKFTDEYIKEFGPEFIFKEIQQTEKKFNKEGAFYEVYEDVLKRIIYSVNRNDKDSLDEVVILEKEMELYKLAVKYGYTDRAKVIERNQKKIEHIKNVDLYEKRQELLNASEK